MACCIWSRCKNDPLFYRHAATFPVGSVRTTGNGLHRRTFLASAATATGMAALGAAPARAARYTRYNVTSTEGRQMLASYAEGVAAMLQLPPDHPHNWFRNAFTHFMDCPHGN